MTALCGGGTSSPKPGAPQLVAFTAAALDILLTDAGLAWLIPFLSAVEVPLLQTNELCGNDPPDLPTFTFDDVAALLSPTQYLTHYDSIQKVADLVHRIAWYLYCKCDSVTTPTLPVPIISEPADLPVVLGGSQSICVPMLRSQVKVLNLWNGTQNVSAPTGWDSPTFDDSAWAYSSTPAIGDGVWYGPGNVGLDANYCLSRTQCEPERIAPWVNTSSGKEQFLVRWRFNLPPFDPGKICPVLWQGFNIDAPATGWTTGLTNINGKGQFVTWNAGVRWHFSQDLLPGSNIVAHHINSGAGAIPAGQLWGTFGWISQAITFAGGLGTAEPNPCGALSARAEALLEQIKALVTLIQRQAVPFAYIAGASHTGLSGSGEIDVQGLIGVSITPDSLPSWSGVEVGDPDTLWLDSWINWGNGDGWTPREFLRSSPHVSMPRAAGQFTKLGYSLKPGLTVTITELTREF